MHIDPIAAGFDTGMNNLMWVISSSHGSSVAIVDPGYADPIFDYLNKRNKTISEILITHHHYDHTNGVVALAKQFPNVPIYGPKDSPFTDITHPLKDGDKLSLKHLAISFEIIATPGHTLDHICYYSKDIPLCFVGDTVFGAGAGGLFEGDAALFWHSTEKIKQLPAETLLYYGHDYTLENLYFAKKAESNNPLIDEHIQQCQNNQQQGLYNGSSTVATEHLINPFWRCDQETIKHACEEYAGKPLPSVLDVFTTVREWR